MISDLLLLSGTDIPFQQAQIVIHQPRIKEIAFISEEAFFLGCEILNFSKEMLNAKDKTGLEDKSNFDILMSIMRDHSNNPSIQKNKVCATMVLTLIFPNHNIYFNKNSIDIIEENDSTKIHKIDNSNFELFKDIIIQMFCLNQSNGKEPEYNPGSTRAAEIAAKLRKGRAEAAKAKGEQQKIAILSRYMSILAVGNHKTFESLCNYTVYQLFDEFGRFEMKNNFDMYFKMKLAGAQDIEEVDNWMKDIHS